MTLHSEAPLWSPGPTFRSTTSVTDVNPTMVVVVPESELRMFTVPNYTQVAMHTTGSALQQIAAMRPSLVIVDLDHTACDGYQVCRTARDIPTTTTLVTTAKPERVPAATRAV